jgi:hypothetical protein
MMIGYLVAVATRHIAVGVANEILRAGPMAADLHRELDTELAKDDNSNAYLWALRSERAYVLQALDEQHGGWLLRAYSNDQKCVHLDQLAEWIALANSSYAQFQDYGRLTKAESGGVRHVLSHLLAPSALKVREADFRVRCMVRCLRVLNSLTAKNVASIPAKLTDLGLTAEATVDPYTDKPLVVKRTDGQWVVYGLGANQTDDGGNFENLEDVGIGPIKQK